MSENASSRHGPYEYISFSPRVPRDSLSDFIEECNPVIKAFDWQCSFNITAPPRLYGDLELIYVLDGESIITIDGKVYHGFANDLFVIPRYSFCQIDTNPDDPHENYWMHLAISDELSWKRFEALLGGPLLHLKEDPVLKQFYRYLDLYWRQGGAGNYLCIQSLLYLILTRIIRKAKKIGDGEDISIKPIEKSSSRSQLLRNSIQLINSRRGMISVDALCKELYVTPNYMRRVFHDVIGQSPLSFIRSVRMREADMLLITTNEPISSIALQLGFASPYHFDNEFRKFHSITPTQYRKQYFENLNIKSH